jgi:transaldolase
LEKQRLREVLLWDNANDVRFDVKRSIRRMNELLFKARKEIVFLQDGSKFSLNCQNFINELEQLIKKEPQKKKEILTVAADICLDLQSFLINWYLKKHIGKDIIRNDALVKEVDNIQLFIAKYNDTELLDFIKKEAAEIAKSNIKKICEMELSGKLFTYWGHDYCSGLSHSLRRGAILVTSNPAKINLFRKDLPEIWSSMVKEIKDKHPGISLEKLISYLFVKVVTISAKELFPIYEVSNGKFGYAHIQVNPKNWKDSDKMIEEVEFWNEEFKKELNTDKPNIIYKLPAVSNAIKAVEVLAGKGYRICMTLNFTCFQHEIFSNLIEKGKRNGSVVLMSGFLDDAVDKELSALGIENSKMYSKHAGEAVIRRSYADLRTKGCRKTVILSAAIRGDWTINNTLTSYSDVPMYFTTMTEKIKEYDSDYRSLTPILDEAVPEEFMSVLRKSSIFNAAYEKDILNLKNLDEYIPLQNVLGIFLKAYEELEENLS